MYKKIFTPAFLCLITIVSTAQNCAPASAFDFLDINNVKARINNGGDMWWDLIQNAQYLVPKNGNASSLFAGALWIGGIDANGQLRVAAQTYRQTGNDFFPGPLDTNGNTSQMICQNFDRIWKVNKSAIDSFIQGMYTMIPPSILEWPGRGNLNLSFMPDQDLAPFIDIDGDGIYNPGNGDYPQIPGDQALWFVFNDMGNEHSQTHGEPLGLEVQCMAYAVHDSASSLNNATFYNYKLLYKGSFDLDSTFVGIWLDPSLGCGDDDNIGCDSLRSLGFVYNAYPHDGGCSSSYGDNPPILAIDILQGPADENQIVHSLDYCMSYQNDFSELGNPTEPIHYYNYLHSIFKDGAHLTYGGYGYNGSTSSNYYFSGDPSNLNGWSQCGGFGWNWDSKMILSSGPFTIHPNEVKMFDIAVIWNDSAVYPCPSFSQIADQATTAENYFKQLNFQTTTCNTLHASHPVNVVPNPVAQSGNIGFTASCAEKIIVYDCSGKILLERKIQGESMSQLSTKGWSKSIYLYKVIFADGEVNGKFIVQ
ncbi:MAG: T9SS type A sorting domain-containing protein [Chitinophagales bacterium]